MPLPQIHVWRHDFGQFELSDEFVAQAARKWPGEFVHSVSWLDRLAGIKPRREPKWTLYVHEPLQRLAERAYTSRVTVKRIKSLAALPSMKAA